MKQCITLLAAGVAVGLLFSCNKNSGYTVGTDHTAGMTTTARIWTGPSNGYAYADSFNPLSNVHIQWPKYFSRTIPDTSATVQKVNDFAITMFGNLLRYRSTDSAAQTVRFDTTYSGCSKTEMVYYYAKDSMTFEFHKLFEQHAASGIWIQTHEQVLHTHH